MGEVIIFPARGEKNHSHNLRYPTKQAADSVATDTAPHDFHLQINVQENTILKSTKNKMKDLRLLQTSP